MKDTTFIEISAPACKNVANGFPFSPTAEVATPIKIEKKIRANIFSRDSNFEKSDTVRIPTI